MDQQKKEIKKRLLRVLKSTLNSCYFAYFSIYISKPYTLL
nr:MAG TPA: hypothetical protein [Caudoviricetes sp.]